MLGSSRVTAQLAAFQDGFSSVSQWVSEYFYTVGTILWTGDQPVARLLPANITAQTQNQSTQTSMSQVRFEPTVPVFVRMKIVHSLGRAATLIDYWTVSCAFCRFLSDEVPHTRSLRATVPLSSLWESKERERERERRSRNTVPLTCNTVRILRNYIPCTGNGRQASTRYNTTDSHNCALNATVSFEMWCRAVRHKFTDVSEERTASIFTIGQ
jgi:hypothetical protein